MKIKCILCIWRLAIYVIILYKPHSIGVYCENLISQSKNIWENTLRDYSDFDLFVTSTVLWVRKSIPLTLFEVSRLRMIMRSFAASDIFYRTTFYYCFTMNSPEKSKAFSALLSLFSSPFWFSLTCHEASDPPMSLGGSHGSSGTSPSGFRRTLERGAIFAGYTDIGLVLLLSAFCS